MFTWFGSIMLALCVMAFLAISTKGHIQVGDASDRFVLTGILGVAAYAACIMATMLGATLNRDRDHLAYIWTRPGSRSSTAISYVLIDVATIWIAFAFGAVLGVMLVQQAHIPYTIDPDLGIRLVRVAAIPLMWYGIIELATSWNGLRGGLVAGLSWAVFWFELGLAQFHLPAPWSWVIAVLNFLNPMAYFSSSFRSHTAHAGAPMIPLDLTMQAVLVWAIAISALSLAVYAWKRMEV
jgi:hypothetical protein